FSAQSVKDRVEDAGARLVITADGAHRAGHVVELKKAVDEALSQGCKTVHKHAGNKIDWKDGRDLSWQDLAAKAGAECEPEWVEAEHPLYLLYTSGSTGKPKGIQHSSAGYLLG